MPVFLLSAQSVLMRDDLHFNELQLGLAVSCFFGSATLTAPLIGFLTDRVGHRSTTILGSLSSLLGAASLSTWVTNYAFLLICLALLGLANASLQLGANLSLAKLVPPSRQGLGFGIKQSALPFAMLLGGLSVPFISDTVGWRWPFAITAMVAAGVALSSVFATSSSTASSATRTVIARAPTFPLLLCAVAMALGSAAVNSLAAFLPAWAFTSGLTTSEAGFLMALGSGLSIAARILFGHAADRHNSRMLSLVIGQFIIAAAGLTVISLATPFTVIFGTVAAFCLGWSWPGVLHFAVVLIGREAPGSASGAAQAGAFLGGASGPILFGLVVTTHGYPTAWKAAAGVMLLAAVCLTMARRLLAAGAGAIRSGDGS